MKKRTLAALSILATLGLGISAAAPANASGSTIHLSYAHPNSAGKDYGSNTSLNDEWVKIGNYSYTTTYNLSGWTLKDAAGHTYHFPAMKVHPRTTIVVHTGAGTNTSTNLYWGSGWYIWNNTGDKAYLRTGSGYLNSTCTWSSVSDGVTVHC